MHFLPSVTNFNILGLRLLPYFIFSFCIVTLVALYYALVASPIDYQQGEYVRIMYVHVPAAWLALAVYFIMACCSFSTIIWGTKLSYLIAVSLAPVGCAFSLITLVTGSLWGYPIWGTYWVWDARLTSMLVLFFFYLAYIGIINAEPNILRAEKPSSVIALLGVINIPIVKFSVKFWHSLHQPDSIITSNGPQIDLAMLVPLILMFISYFLYVIINVILRFNNVMSELKYDSRSNRSLY
ncbi:MAG: heme ABC transporter permease [Rickettsiaceae bacterium]|nr:heme ABC transporter permease [Rickettsiaceae bacterium]